MIKIESASDTDIGHKRESNQDRFFEKTERVSNVMCGLYCVADGMGGLSDGNYAATVTVAAIEQWWNERLPHLLTLGVPEKTICEEIQALLYSINETILSRAQDTGTRIGTTCSLLFMCENFYCIAHSGDSRIYFMQRCFFGRIKMKQITPDHTWRADQLHGTMPLSEIEANPKRNMLTGCLGVFQKPRVFVSLGHLKNSGAFLLCSDGLYRMFSEQELKETTLRNNKRCTEIVDTLIDTALKRGTSVSV